MNPVTHDRARTPARPRAKTQRGDADGPRLLAQPKYLTHAEAPGTRSPPDRPPACAGTLFSGKRQSHTLRTMPCFLKRLNIAQIRRKQDYSPENTFEAISYGAQYVIIAVRRKPH